MGWAVEVRERIKGLAWVEKRGRGWRDWGRGYRVRQRNVKHSSVPTDAKGLGFRVWG